MSRKEGAAGLVAPARPCVSSLQKTSYGGPERTPQQSGLHSGSRAPASPSSPTPHLLTTCVPFCTPGRFGANPTRRPIGVSECLNNVDKSGKTTAFFCLKTNSFLILVQASSLGTLPVVRRFCSCRVTSREMLASLWPVSAS